MEDTTIAFRLFAMTLGGKLSLCYLCMATFLFVFAGRALPWIPMVLGFPVVYAVVILDPLFGGIGPSQTAVVLYALLWVGNAYFWGHVIAAIAGRNLRHKRNA